MKYKSDFPPVLSPYLSCKMWKACSTEHPLWKVGLKVTPWEGMSGNHTVQYLYTYKVRERDRLRMSFWETIFSVRGLSDERLVAMFFQDPSLLQFSQDLIKQTEWIPCCDTVIPHLLLWRQAFLNYNGAPAPTAHICSRGFVQPMKMSSCKCCIFPKCYLYHTFYKNMLPEKAPLWRS